MGEIKNEARRRHSLEKIVVNGKLKRVQATRSFKTRSVHFCFLNLIAVALNLLNSVSKKRLFPHTFVKWIDESFGCS
jgi:hypothetical protein